MQILTKALVTEVRHDGYQFQLVVNRNVVVADQLLVAAGRRSNTAELGLDTAGILLTDKGEIQVDTQMRTSVPHIYAAGDCTPLPQYVYVAAAAGKVAAIDLLVMPQVIFTDPQVASVGLTEQHALSPGLQVESCRLDLDQVQRALVNFDTTEFIKLVAEK